MSFASNASCATEEIAKPYVVFCLIAAALHAANYLSEVCEKIKQKDITRRKIIALFRKLRQVRTSRVNIRLNNSMCSLQLKRELYQNSEAKSIAYCGERNHHCSHLLRNLDNFPIELLSRNHLISPL